MVLTEAFERRCARGRRRRDGEAPGPQVRVTATRPGAGFLEVLDERLREVAAGLADTRARRAGAGRRRLHRPARQPVRRPPRPALGHPPQAAGHRGVRRRAPPATGEAVRAFRAEGRRHIAVASLFLTPGVLTDRAAELALEAGAVAVSDPLGAHPEVARIVLARYAVGAVELVPV